MLILVQAWSCGPWSVRGAYPESTDQSSRRRWSLTIKASDRLSHTRLKQMKQTKQMRDEADMMAASKVPLVSVIVPNYNHAPYLQERLDSIRNQTFQDFELIVLDDASTDDSVQIIKACLAGYDYQLIQNEQNSGSTFKQWDKGVSFAKGKYIWMAESDDVAEPTLLEKLVSSMEGTDSALAYCQSLGIDENSTVISEIKGWTDGYSRHLWSNNFSMDGNFFCIQYMAIKCVIPNASAVLFRRDCYISPVVAPPCLRLAGDWMLWIRILLQRRICFVAEPLNRFRFLPGSVRKTRHSIYFQECVRCTLYDTRPNECLAVSSRTAAIEAAPVGLVVRDWPGASLTAELGATS